MKVPRFRDSERWHEQMAQLRVEADAALDALGNTDVSIAAVGLIAAADDAESWALICAAVPTLPAALQRDIGRFLDGQIELESASWAAITRAFADWAVRGEPSPKRIVEANERLQRSPQWVNRAFEECCIAKIEALPAEEKERWLVELERPLTLVAPEEAPRNGAVQIFRQKREWVLADPFDLWGGDVPWAIEAVWAYLPLDVFRRLSPERWFRSVDGWSDARLVGGALFGDHVHHDRAALLSWLEAAAPAFDDDGPWTGRTAVLILTRDVLRHAKMLLDAVDRIAADPEEKEMVAAEVMELRTRELPPFFDRAWEILLARSDGRRIAAALLADLADPAHDRRGRELLVRELAHDALARALATRRVRTGELRDQWIERRKARKDNGLERYAAHASGLAALASAADVIEHGGPGDDDLFAFLLDRVAEPDEAWSRLARADALTRLVARVLRAARPTTAFLERCERLYEALEPSRRRGEFARSDLARDEDLPSLLTLLILIALADEAGIDPQRGAEATRNAARWATRLVLTGASTDPTISAPRILALAAQQSARMAPDVLPTLIRVALPDPPFAAVLVSSLLSALSTDAVDALLRAEGVTLDQLAARANLWAEATQRPADGVAAKNLSERLRQ